MRRHWLPCLSWPTCSMSMFSFNFVYVTLPFQEKRHLSLFTPILAQQEIAPHIRSMQDFEAAIVCESKWPSPVLHAGQRYLKDGKARDYPEPIFSQQGVTVWKAHLEVRPMLNPVACSTSSR